MILLIKFKTALALGIVNLARVFFYRIGVKFGFNPVKKLTATLVAGDYFLQPRIPDALDLSVNRQWLGKHTYLGWHVINSDLPPDWHANIFTGAKVIGSNQPWWQISDFDLHLGDIKTVWEASRFDWVIGFAQAAAAGDVEAINKLNIWLVDWTNKNSPYLGPNWKCGQEASIRVMHLAFAAFILQQHQQTSQTLLQFIKAHLQRIAPTVSYAIAQDNNHGTSEAAALYIGGGWIAANGDIQGKYWQKQGQKLLENRAQRLIETDGSFSQYSVNYHRVMLDTYSMAEVWRNKIDLPLFSDELYRRLAAATNWLYQFTQSITGDAPNLGANDGARLLPLTDTDYRDFRPSVQLAMVLFNKTKAWKEDGNWNLPLHWLNIAIPSRIGTQSSCQFDKGGYSLLRNGESFALFKYPRFRFRPSQNDALHLDFWVNGINLLRDGGSYSYNTSDNLLNYFGGAISHNTVQFDDREQMPRLSRFLLGNWLKAKKVCAIEIDGDQQTCAAGYVDSYGASHYRKISLSKGSIRIDDYISGFCHKAVLRWRLLPGEWKLDRNAVTNGKHCLTVNSNRAIIYYSLGSGEESRYYLHKTSLPVLEVKVTEPCHLYTEYFFPS
jgi:hypothetical protein